MATAWPQQRWDCWRRASWTSWSDGSTWLCTHTQPCEAGVLLLCFVCSPNSYPPLVNPVPCSIVESQSPSTICEPAPLLCGVPIPIHHLWTRTLALCAVRIPIHYLWTRTLALCSPNTYPLFVNPDSYFVGPKTNPPFVNPVRCFIVQSQNPSIICEPSPLLHCGIPIPIHHL